MKSINTLVMIALYGFQDVRALTAEQKITHMQYVKQSFKKQALLRETREEDAIIDRLPVSPVTLLERYPEVYRAAFHEDSPIPCQVNLMAFHEINLSYRCRLIAEDKCHR